MLLYHLVCPAKYRKVIFDKEIHASLVEICSEISIRYEIEFIEISTDTQIYVKSFGEVNFSILTIIRIF